MKSDAERKRKRKNDTDCKRKRERPLGVLSSLFLHAWTVYFHLLIKSSVFIFICAAPVMLTHFMQPTFSLNISMIFWNRVVWLPLNNSASSLVHKTHTFKLNSKYFTSSKIIRLFSHIWFNSLLDQLKSSYWSHWFGNWYLLQWLNNQWCSNS